MRPNDRFRTTLAIALLCALPAFAEDPRSVASVAEEATAAHARGNAEVLRALAARQDPDPWLVAEALWCQGRGEAALAFAGAHEHPELEGLPAVVAAAISTNADLWRSARDRLAQVDTAVDEARWEQALVLTALESGDVPEDPYLAARLLELRAWALVGAERTKDAIVAFDEAARHARSAGWLRGAVKILHFAGAHALILGDTARGAALWRERLEVQYLRHRPEAVSQAARNLGSLHASVGEFRPARAYFREALEFAERAKSPRAEAVTWSMLGLLEMEIGSFQRSLSAHEEARRLYALLGDVARVVLTLAYLGSVHEQLGHYEEAHALLSDALAQTANFPEPADPGLVALVKGNLGAVLMRLERWESAVHHLQAAKPVFEATGEWRLVARAEQNLGEARAAQKNVAAARQHYVEARRLYTAMKDLYGIASISILEARLKADAGNSLPALELYAIAIDQARETGSILLEGQALAGVARLQYDLDFLGAAVDTAREAVERIHDLWTGLAPTEGAYARRALREVYETGALAALGRGNAEEAYVFLEHGRTGELLESLSLREILERTPLSKALADDVEAASARVTTAHLALRRARDTGRLKEIRPRLRELREATADLRRALASATRYRKAAGGAVTVRPAESDEVRAALDENEALILYGVFEAAALAVVVRPKALSVVDLGPVSEIRKRCAAAGLDDVKSPVGDARRVLHELLVSPLELPEEVERVVVCPAGPLYTIPFAWLIPKRRVVSAPSATIHLQLHGDAEFEGEGVLALGGVDYSADRRLRDLPSSGAEARRAGTTVLVEKNATRPRLFDAWQRQKRWRGQHFACHAVLNTEHPFETYLALTPATGETPDAGRLTGLDVLRHGVPADLVVLAACDSGRGRVVPGEGLLGLQRAFLYTGATRVLSSLWRVDDPAAEELMGVFHEQWNPPDGSPGLPPAAALQVAQDHVQKNAAWRDPYYWAGWVLWGP